LSPCGVPLPQPDAASPPDEPEVHQWGSYDPTLAEEIEGFLVTLPGWLIEPAAMTEILALLHAA